MNRVKQAQDIVEAQKEIHGNLYRLANKWGINYSYLWHLLNSGRLSPTLDDFLVELGYLETDPLRHRICYEAGYGEAGLGRKHEVYDWLARHNFESLTALIDEIIPRVDGEEEE